MVPIRPGEEPGARMVQMTVRASLQVIHSADAALQGKVFDLGGPEFTIGREEGNHLVVSTEQASRRHARLVAGGGGFLVQDLGSTNGTYVNSKAVQEQRLIHGDVIRVATTVLKYVVGEGPPAAR